MAVSPEQAKVLALAAARKRRDEEQRLRGSLNMALDSNPDQFARAREIEAQTGIPANVVERNFERVDPAVRAKEFNDILRSAPRLRGLMAEPEFAKLTHDDLDNAITLEQALQRQRAEASTHRTPREIPTGPMLPERAVRNVAAGALPRVSAGSYGLLQWGSEQLWHGFDLLGRIGLIPANPMGGVPPFFARQRRSAERLAEDWSGDLSQAGPVERGVYSGLQSMGQNLPIVAAAAFTAQPELVALTSMSALEAGHSYGQARDAGIDPATATAFATSNAIIEAATERIPVGKLFGDLASDSGLFKMLIGQLISEVPGEQVATLAQDLNQWAVLNPDKPFAAYLEERPSAAAETLIATLVATGAQTGGMVGLRELMREQDDRVSAELANANAKRLADIAQLATESKLRERAPEAFERFVQHASQDGDLTDVYVDARALGQVLEQAGVTPADVSPAVAAQMDEALAVGGDVRIPVGEFAARIATAEYAQQLMPHLRTSPEAMSQAEAETFNQQGAEQLKQQAEQLIAEQAEDEAYQQSVLNVEGLLREQLAKANRFTPDVNNAYVAMMRDFYVTTADKLGITPDEMYQRYPLRVTAESVTGGLEQLAPSDLKVTNHSDGGFRVGEHDNVAIMDVARRGDAYQIVTSHVDKQRRGEGIGQQLITAAYDEAVRRGGSLTSDTSVSVAQLRAYEALKRKGWTIEYSDPAEVQRALATNDVEESAATGHRPVVSRIEPPANYNQTQRPAASARLATANVPAPRAGTRRFRHFGNKVVRELSPQFMGTGMPGAERRRAPVQSISLYPDTGFQKESGVGPHEYVVDVDESRLYNVDEDPEGFLDEAIEATAFTVDENGKMVPASTRTDFTRFEQLVKEAGYAGYFTPDAEGNLRGQARIFEPIPVEQAAELERMQKSGVLFQLAPKLEPQGFATIKPHLAPDELEKLRADTVQKLVQVFKDLPADADFAAAAMAGIAKRGWYEHAARAIRQVFGDTDAPRFAALLAALSPQIGIKENFLHAVQMWANWDEAGRPTSADEINAILEKSVYGGQQGSVLGAWRNNTVRALTAEDATRITLSGPKVNSFMRNLMGDVQEVTNDTWMANFALVDQTLFKGALNKSGPGKSTGYVAMNAKIRRVAARLTKETGELWTPAEVQETVWSWAKTAVELADAAGETRSVEELVRAGEITDARVASAPDFATMFKNDATIREILEKAGYGEAIEAIEVEFGRKATPQDQQKPGVTPGLLRSARRLDELRRQRDADSADRRTAEREETAGEDVENSGGLVGLPTSSPGPLPAIQELANAYVRDVLVNKPDVPPHTIYVKVDPARGARIAQAYEEAQHQPDDFEVQIAYDALIDETLAQFQEVKKLGLNIEFIEPGQANPYPEGPRQVFEDVRRGHLWVFPTDSGFGTESDGAGHPLLRATNEKIGDRVLLANDVFRIVHDIFGHAKEGNGFGANGEENAWHSHVRMYSPLAARAMTTETRGQNSWVNWGPHGEANRANQQNTVYADQKATLLPEWVMTDGLLDGSAQPAQVLEQSAVPQAQTDAFKKWFGSSAVVNEDGTPQVVYHGTNAAFDTFDKEARGRSTGHPTSALGFFFSSSPDEAAVFATGTDARGRFQPGGENLMPVYLAVENPYPMSADEFGGLFKTTSSARMQKFREQLVANGYDGIHVAADPETPYEELQNADTWIAFEPTQIKSAIGNSGTFDPNDPNILDQGEGGAPRGQIALDGKGGATIALLKNADLSTFLHESGHFFLEVYADIAAQPNAPESIAKDFAALLNWFGVKDAATWQAMTLEQRRDNHEKFARGFEAYLFEGKAPTPELTSLFSKFRSWLINVYRTLTQLNVELSDEVRGVFGRMLASEAAIGAVEQARQATPMFTSAEEAGMTDDEYQTYVTTNEAAHDVAVDELQRKSLRDMQWASRARARELKRLQADAAAKRKSVRDEAASDVRAEPVYQALRFLTTGEVTTETGEVLKTDAPHRLDRDAVEQAKYGDIQMQRLEPLLRKNGVPPDHVAEMFGFTSGDHLIRAITDAPPLEDAIEAETDKRTLERYGDITNITDMERAADQAVHNEARLKFVATELRALDRMMSGREKTSKGGSVNVNTKVAKQFAETLIARRKIRDLKPQQFATAETRAAKNAQAELAAGNLQGAAIEKRNQLVNGHAVAAAYDAQHEIDRSLTYLRKFDNDATRQKLDDDYLQQIDKLLERFDLRRRTASPRELAKRQALLKWVEAQRALGLEPEIDESLLDEARRILYRQLTVEQFRGLVDTVRNIEHLGRLKHRLLTSQEERELEAVIDSMADVVEDNATRDVQEKLERNTWVDSFKDGVAGFFAMHRKFASIIRQMSGGEDGGALWQHLVRPLNEASTKEARMRADATAALTKLFKPLMKLGPLNGDKRYIPEIDRSLTREGRLAVALNQGTETNKLRVTEGDKWSPAQVQAILDTLSKEEWDFVQGVWDYIGSYWPEIAAKEKRVTGLTPEKVEATPVRTKHGEYRGGYYPIKYDPSRSSKAEADVDAEAIRQSMQGLYTRATTRRGHTKARAESVQRPMRKDLGVIFEHLSQVTHDLAFHEYLIDANRLLRSNKLDSAIRAHYGPQYLTQLRKTLEDVAKGDTPAQNAMERAINYLRTGTTVAGLGWNLTTALLQPLGLTQSMVRIWPRYVARGIAQFLGSPAHMQETLKNIYDKSDMMRLRGQTMQREISELRSRIHGGEKMSNVQASFFYLIQQMQKVADVPTWLGAYEKAIETGSDEKEAVALADQAVLDAQGGGQIKDLAAIQRGGPLQKLWTNFYSFFNTTYNLMAERANRTDFKKPGDVGKLAADFALLYIIPATLGSLLRMAMGGGDDDDEMGEKLVRDNLSYLFGSMVLLRELGSAMSGYDYKGPSGGRFFSEMANLQKQVEQGELDEAALRAFLNVAGVLFHIPSGQLWRTGAGINALAQGETNNPAALITGPQD